ncbi:grpE protein homolog 2, mitochondrial-like isoform X1 [Mangifera indica]|uniref:grpE protein homolog 2, mitochondrial-like isoform X1 n=1 Tax=Mangifera indica TaxID=29780 RepID=UPI001CFB9072|nr:grpE protein homolog 2, mitochondrial-like isoform X1 [Mangifera indica]
MLASRVLSRVSRSVGQRSLLLLSSSKDQQSPIISNLLNSVVYDPPNKFVASQASLFHHSALSSSPSHRFWFSSASPESKEKEQGSAAENNGVESGDAKASDNVEDTGRTEVNDQTKESGQDSEPQSTMSQSIKRRSRGTKRTAFSDSDSESESDLSREDLVKLLKEREELLKAKHKEMENMQDKVLRTFAEMENIKERTRREAENSKKFAIQNFAKSLLDVADNLGRASSVVKESFSKIDVSNDATGSAQLLKSLLEGVEMTEKQLGEVFKKFGLEKYDPTDEPFDPHRHNAVFQVQDNSKPPGTVAHVLKSGYTLYERVIRPAEVGVTQAVEGDAANNNEA